MTTSLMRNTSSIHPQGWVLVRETVVGAHGCAPLHGWVSGKGVWQGSDAAAVACRSPLQGCVSSADKGASLRFVVRGVRTLFCPHPRPLSHSVLITRQFLGELEVRQILPPSYRFPPRAGGTKPRFPLRSRGNLTEGVFKKCRAMSTRWERA